MSFIIRGFIWDIPIRVFAYVPFLGPYKWKLEAGKVTGFEKFFRSSVSASVYATNPKGPCTQIVYTLALKYSIFRYFGGQCIYYLGTWTLRILGLMVTSTILGFRIILKVQYNAKPSSNCSTHIGLFVEILDAVEGCLGLANSAEKGTCASIVCTLAL